MEVSERPRKRRAINACVSCRSSKVRCDGRNPCQRCHRNDTVCQYQNSASARDESIHRIERLEVEVAALRHEMGHLGNVSRTLSTTNSSPLQGRVSEHNSADIANGGLGTWEQKTAWFQSFFSGSQYLVPIFCEKYDTLASVSSRSTFLLDAIVSIGCRAEEGFNSQTYRQFQARLRDHLASVLIGASTPTYEDIQAITLMAAYSENGTVLIALALRFAVQRGLPQAVDRLVARCTDRAGFIDLEEKELYRLVRLWYGVCNIELFFSLDGGKMPGMTLQVSPRKIRSLINHPERTPVDVRLLSQIELNITRSEAYSKLNSTFDNPSLMQDDTQLRTILDNTSVELSLWHDEWATVVSADPLPDQRLAALQNLNIQHQWALLTLHLKAVATTGIENIALMTEFQQDSVRKAKEAAAFHLQYVLEASVPPFASPHEVNVAHTSTYLSTFKWALDYVWAKCAFSVLLVLKLAILLRDPVPSVMLLLRDAHRLLEELKRVTVGHIAYFQILQTSIEKCEAALREYVSQQSTVIGHGATSPESAGAAEDDFQDYVPSEFVFEWDFPGLNLKHMPLGWQDYFINIDGLF